jgi:hypothetical protein
MMDRNIPPNRQSWPALVLPLISRCVTIGGAIGLATTMLLVATAQVSESEQNGASSGDRRRLIRVSAGRR